MSTLAENKPVDRAPNALREGSKVERAGASRGPLSSTGEMLNRSPAVQEQESLGRALNASGRVRDLAQMQRAASGAPPGELPSAAAIQRRMRPTREVGDPGAIVQRRLVATPHGYSTDDRDANATQRFTLQQNGTWQDQGGYVYRYTAAEELSVVAHNGVAYAANRYWDTEHQVELQKHTHAAGNGANLHVYVVAGQANNWQNRRYYDAHHRYQPVPTNRVLWIDDRLQFVDQYDRVLTPNGQGVDKQYAVTKEGRDYIVPFKDLNQGFLPGLPDLFEGNVDPGETANQAVAREIGEESGNGVALNAMGGLLAQQQAAFGNDRNRYTIRDSTVTTQAPNAPLHEKAGSFRFTASDFVGHTASALATKTRLLALFEQHTLADPNLGAYAQNVQNLGGNALAQWRGAHVVEALAGKIGQDVASYEAGRDLARASQPLPLLASAEQQAGYQEYQQGVTDARANLAVAHAHEPAYTMGHADYLLGLAHAQAGQNLQLHAGYAAAIGDYAQGLQSAQGNQVAANQHRGYTAARTEYQQGWQSSRDRLVAANLHHAYTTGRNEYRQGFLRAQGNQAPASNAYAYMEGYQDFI